MTKQSFAVNSDFTGEPKNNYIAIMTKPTPPKKQCRLKTISIVYFKISPSAVTFTTTSAPPALSSSTS